jgi:hypothetical protein
MLTKIIQKWEEFYVSYNPSPDFEASSPNTSKIELSGQSLPLFNLFGCC